MRRLICVLGENVEDDREASASRGSQRGRAGGLGIGAVIDDRADQVGASGIDPGAPQRRANPYWRVTLSINRVNACGSPPNPMILTGTEDRWTKNFSVLSAVGARRNAGRPSRWRVGLRRC